MSRYELPPVEDRALWDIWLSMYQLPATAVADELGVFTRLAAEPATDLELAVRLALDARATRVLLDLLVAIGLLAQRERRYELTALGRTYLLPDSPYYWGPLLKTLGIVRPLHASLMRALRPRTGGPAVGRPAEAWARGDIDVEAAAHVSRVMHCHSLPAAVGVAMHGGFEHATRVLDVGGGSGCFAIAIAQRHPSIRCTVLELPAVCEVARGYIADGGVTDRVDTHAADMFRDAWPAGYDAILMSNVFHDWSSDTNTDLARRAFAALPSGGRVLLHEMLLADGEPSPPSTAAFSMLMLLTNEGRQYQLSELRRVLGDAGFVDVSARPSYGRYSIITGTKA